MSAASNVELLLQVMPESAPGRQRIRNILELYTTRMKQHARVPRSLQKFTLEIF